MALTLDDKPWWMGLLVGLLLAGGVVYGVESFLVKDIKKDIASADTAQAFLGTQTINALFLKVF